MKTLMTVLGLFLVSFSAFADIDCSKQAPAACEAMHKCLASFSKFEDLVSNIEKSRDGKITGCLTAKDGHTVNDLYDAKVKSRLEEYISNYLLLSPTFDTLDKKNLAQVQAFASSADAVINRVIADGMNTASLPNDFKESFDGQTPSYATWFPFTYASACQKSVENIQQIIAFADFESCRAVVHEVSRLQTQYYNIIDPRPASPSCSRVNAGHDVFGENKYVIECDYRDGSGLHEVQSTEDGVSADEADRIINEEEK